MTNQLAINPETGRPYPLSYPLDAADLPWLPDSASRKIKALRQQRDDAYVMMRSVNDKITEARADKIAADMRLREVARSYSPRFDVAGKLPDDAPAVVAEINRRDAAVAEIARLQEVHEVRRARWEEVNRLVTAVEEYATNKLAAGVTIDVLGGPQISLAKNETLDGAIERRRRRLRELDADTHAVEAAPWHADQAKRRAIDEIERLAMSGAPGLMSLVETERSGIRWPVQSSRRIGDRVVRSNDIDGAGLLVWLHRDALIARVQQEIDAISDDKSALTREERAARLAEIASDRLATEREEEALIASAEAVGRSVLRRSDADPRAVLGLADSCPPAERPW